MHREAFVEERVVRGQELDDASIAAQHAVDEERELLLHEVARIEQAAGLRELASVGDDLVELRNVEPLEREIFDERLGALIGQHAADLLRQHSGLAQAVVFGELEQLRVRQAAPQEEGQPRRELDVAQRDRAAVLSRLRAIHEVRAREDCAQCIAHAAFEAALAGTRVIERHQALEIGVCHRATERALGEARNDINRARSRVGSVGGPTDEDLLAACGIADARDRQGPTNLERVRRLDALLAAFECDGSRALVALGVAAVDERDGELMLAGRSLESGSCAAAR